MNRVVKILMERDGITEDEAKAEVNLFRESAMEAIEDGDYEEVEEMLMMDLGLEPDFIFDLI